MQELPKASPRGRDVQLNKAHILDVARQAFGSQGVDVSMDAVAKLAGVGPGTLYRHFPNKDALLAALLVDHYDALDLRRVEIEAQESDPARVLDLWIDALGEWMVAFEGLAEPLRTACSQESPLTPTCQTVIETTERILSAAQQEGSARRTVTGRDVFLGALAIAWASAATVARGNTRQVLREVLRDGWLRSKQPC